MPDRSRVFRTPRPYSTIGIFSLFRCSYLSMQVSLLMKIIFTVILQALHITPGEEKNRRSDGYQAEKLYRGFAF